jgi:excisionase family DNA binding protein
MEQVYELSFQEAMQLGKDAAAHNIERRACLGARVTYKRPPVRRFLTVAEAAAKLGVSTARVRQLIARGAIPGARRGKGRGSGYQVPSVLECGAWTVQVIPGKRGPKSRLVLSQAEACPI